MNFKGPLQIRHEVPEDVEAEPFGTTLRFFAVEAQTEALVEVDLRVGRGGQVYALPVDQAPELELNVLPEPEQIRPVLPAARTTPFDVNDFTSHEGKPIHSD